MLPGKVPAVDNGERERGEKLESPRVPPRSHVTLRTAHTEHPAGGRARLALGAGVSGASSDRL